MDFGKFEPDYYFAHSLAMSHLHGDKGLVDLLKTIPNSASGVLPLWFLGFFTGLTTHRFIWFCLFSVLVVIILITTRFNKFGRYFVWSLALSPMMISSTTWVLPEMFALFVIVVLALLLKHHSWWSVLFAAFVPFSRQTFLVFLYGRSLLGVRNRLQNVLILLTSTLALLVLVVIWGGLVPPKLSKVHLTPSLKAPIVALLITSLYFLKSNLSIIKERKIDKSRMYVAVTLSVLLVLLGLIAPELSGGGYIFSRLESYNFIIAFIIESFLLFTLFYGLKLQVLLYFVLVMSSFSTTNYLFLKYVDFYFFGFLALGMSGLNGVSRAEFENYAISGLYFQFFSLSLACVYYL